MSGLLTQAGLGNLALGLLILGFLLWRQRQARRFRSGFIVPIVLIIIGIGSLSAAVSSHPPNAMEIGRFVGVLTLDGVGLGIVRAYTVRLRIDETGQIWRQGTWWTVGLWLLGIAAHIAFDGVAGIGSVSTLLYLGITLGAQRLVLRARVRSMTTDPTLTRPNLK